MKAVAQAWKAGYASDPGRKRGINEDRVLVDEERGIFLVVDGLGGHAAGELAAETAVEVIRDRLEPAAAHPAEAVREAITEANNRVHDLAQSNEDWRGMACVLTLALLQEDRVTVGHVGDTRLYLFWNGALRKITSDHSPVGEQEDHGLLTESEAMHHPRRNEVFRDVGSSRRHSTDADFIEVRQLPFRRDAALLICSDGLTDVLASADIAAIIGQNSGDPAATASQLVDAANREGGTDNISVIFVAGADLHSSASQALVEARERHSVTRPRNAKPRLRRAAVNAIWLIVGMILGMALWAALERFFPRDHPAPKEPPPHVAAS